jgi:hypothetical protein
MAHNLRNEKNCRTLVLIVAEFESRTEISRNSLIPDERALRVFQHDQSALLGQGVHFLFVLLICSLGGRFGFLTWLESAPNHTSRDKVRVNWML